MRYLVLIAILWIPFFGDELLTNGGFEEPLTVGWTKIQYGSNITIDRGTGYNPDPDYEAYTYKGDGGGYAKLYQTADIPTTNLQFHAQLKLIATATSSAWGAASLVLSYLNSSSGLLGETRICFKTSYCPWKNTSTLHLITVTNGNWNHYEFNIDDELNNLSGVNPSQIKKIRVALFDTTYDC